MDIHHQACRGSTFQKRWLILFGFFNIGFLYVGTIKSFGVLIEIISKDLQTSIGVIGLSIGLSHGVMQCLGIVNIPLLKRFSAGKIVTVGSSLAATGFCLICFATSGIQFTLFILLTGFGFSVVAIPARSSIIGYFPDHFEAATAITVLGGGVGMMILPLLTEQLFIIYGWRGAFLIVGALNFHTCLTGLLMATSNEKRTHGLSSVESQIVDETSSLLSGSESLDQNRMDGEEEEDDDIDVGDDDEITEGHFCSVTSARRLLLDTFGLTLFFDYPRVITIFLTSFIFAVTFCGWIVFLIPNADAKGIHPDRSVLLATVGGAANILGRLALGFQAAMFKARPQVVYCIISTLSALAFILNFSTKSFPILCCFAAVNGFVLGGKIMSLNILCKETVPDERFFVALSLVSLSFGIGEVFGAPFIGLLYNVTKSFDIMFYVLGAANILEALVIMYPVIFDKMVTMATKH